jgi:hypothetical protein
VNTYSTHGCNGDVTWLHCSDTEVIRVKSVMYGRKNASVCTSGSNDTLASCESQTGLSALSPLCNGKQNCALIPSTSLFGDPCPGISKYADIDYSCSGMCVLRAAMFGIEEHL